MARPQKPKIFHMDTEMSTTERKVGAYTIEHMPSGAGYERYSSSNTQTTIPSESIRCRQLVNI